MNIKHLLGVSAAAFFVFGAQAQTPIKIAVMAELSGPQAPLGQDQLDAMTLAVEQNGGKLGGYPVEILRRDSQLKPEVANQIAEQLIERDKVNFVVGLTFSNIVMAVSKKLTSAGVIVVGTSAGPALLAGAQCLPNIFFLSKQNDQYAEAMGKYATEKGFKRVMAIAPNYQAGKDYIGGFKRLYKTPLIEEVYVPLNQMDFATEIARISAEKPDAVYVFLPGGLGVNFVRAYKQAGLMEHIPLLSIGTVDGTNLPALKEDAIGVLHASGWGPDIPNSVNKKFVQDFVNKYKRVPSDYGAQTYDAAMLIGSVLAENKGKVSDVGKLAADMHTAKFASTRGDLKFNNNNFVIQDMYVFQVVKDAQNTVTLKTLEKALPAARDAYASLCPMK